MSPDAAATEPLVAVEDMHTYYGKSHILHGVPARRQGEVVGLLGRNGVGKSTTLKTIMGSRPPQRGKVLLAGRPSPACRRRWRGWHRLRPRIAASSAC